MTKQTIGWLVWRRTTRGGVAPSKVLDDKRKFLLSNSNNQDKERWTDRLVREVPLDAKEWKLGLDELAEKYPAMIAVRG